MKSSPLLFRICQAIHCLLSLATLINYSKADTVRASVDINLKPREPLAEYEYDHSVEVSVDTNGELTSVELPARMQIQEAVMRSEGEEADITCFFYWEKDDSHSQTVSSAFRKYEPLRATEGPVKDFYTRQILCYSHAADPATDNTFTLFIENAQGENELVRMEIGDDERSVALDLRTTQPNLRAGTKAAIVGFPEPRESPSGSGILVKPECETILRSSLSPEDDDRTRRLASKFLNSYIPPTTLADYIICYRDWLDNR